jgi:hypothetical protein
MQGNTELQPHLRYVCIAAYAGVMDNRSQRRQSERPHRPVDCLAPGSTQHGDPLRTPVCCSPVAEVTHVDSIGFFCGGTSPAAIAGEGKGNRTVDSKARDEKMLTRIAFTCNTGNVEHF